LLNVESEAVPARKYLAGNRTWVKENKKQKSGSPNEFGELRWEAEAMKRGATGEQPL